MAWDGGRLRITYNGEVYNYRELRAELEQHGYRFRSQTDTEVILAAYDRWGSTACTASWHVRVRDLDEPRQRLFMARDRLGKKPLYYSARNAPVVRLRAEGPRGGSGVSERSIWRP